MSTIGSGIDSIVACASLRPEIKLLIERFGVGLLGVVSSSARPESEDRESRLVNFGEDVARCNDLGAENDAEEEGRLEDPGDKGAVCQVGVCGAEERGVLVCEIVVCFRLLLRPSESLLRGVREADEVERGGAGEGGGRSMATARRTMVLPSQRLQSEPHSMQAVQCCFRRKQ